MIDKELLENDCKNFVECYEEGFVSAINVLEEGKKKRKLLSVEDACFFLKNIKEIAVQAKKDSLNNSLKEFLNEQNKTKDKR